MASDQQAARGAVGVGAYGVVPGESEGILAELPQDGSFELLAYSDEGLGAPWPDEKTVRHCRDYNVLLQDPAVELVLVDGPVEKRRDAAVRALNAGKHVVTAAPFCETASDGERVMKTAVRQGLVATMELPWRGDADLLAVRAALRETGGDVHGMYLFHRPTPDGTSEAADLLGQETLAMLDQVNVLLTGEVRDVAAHVRSAAGGAATGVMLELSLRGGGWAVAQAAIDLPCELPHWLLYTAHEVIVAAGGKALVRSEGEEACYAADAEAEGFWDNVRAAIRQGADLLAHPAQIVRAMKLHEAALLSSELGEPVTL